ncbi:AAA domain-containing protein [Fusarium keratoplasticum]|nr:AAA domain-containing protein [Fusarium keratoplasticum]
MASRDENNLKGRKAGRTSATREEGRSSTRDRSAMDKTISQDHSNYHGHIFSTAHEEDDGSDSDDEYERERAHKQAGNGEDSKSSDDQSDEGEGVREVLSEEEEDLAQRLAEQLKVKLGDLVEEIFPSGSAASRVMDNLVSTVSRLQVENEMLKEELQAIKTTQLASPEQAFHEAIGSSQGSELVKFVTFHQVLCCCAREPTWTNYWDPPHLFKGDTENDHFRGTNEVTQVEAYLKSHTEISFAVIAHYQCDRVSIRSILAKEGQPGPRGRVLMQDHCPKGGGRKSIMVGPATQTGLQAIIEEFPDQFPGFEDTPRFFNLWGGRFLDNPCFQNLQEPFTLFYLYGKTLAKSFGEVDLDDLTRESLLLLCQWMEDNFREEWDKADALFAQGKVGLAHFKLLFRPGELIVYRGSHEDRSSLRGAVVPWYPFNIGGGSIQLYSWVFNGHPSCSRSHFDPPIELYPTSHSGGRLIDITSLEHYPLRFASKGVKAGLVARGQRFWACRRQKLVCYNENIAGSAFQTERRFMVDYDMFRRLHPSNSAFQLDPRDHISAFEFSNIEEPPEEFLYCLPPEIHGFDFTTKTWKALEVDRITDVTWNKKAFSQLVAPPETKELIQAVVSAHGERKNMGLDIIEGKGQGLLVLLHGGPGTGKTLTAESIAEEQERPLYRVTCGDIGTEPREVERYLGDVLEIGRAWGCVVLLDEADVFLEERSFSDQKRNAIISIFLRILEYYDGIFILTTNRIGSFDEAFKSRIQLALGYPPLNEEDRLKIWSNFVQMLPRTKDRVDMEDLRMNLPKLARDEINGREIRNIITMARHLAKFRKETLRYQHMRDALRSSQKFSEYLNQVKGVSDDDWARADKLR